MFPVNTEAAGGDGAWLQATPRSIINWNREDKEAVEKLSACPTLVAWGSSTLFA